jgi:hypothetical protein
MAGSNVLKEFVIKLGFSLNEAQFRRFKEGMTATAKGAVEMTKSFVKLGESSALAATAMGAALVAAATAASTLARELLQQVSDHTRSLSRIWPETPRRCYWLLDRR